MIGNLQYSRADIKEALVGGATTTVATVAGQGAPITLRMVKNGTSVTGQYWSGVTWVTVGTATVTLTAPIEVGFAVTSHNIGALATATFSNYAHAAPVTTAGTQALARRYVYGSYVDEPLALVNGSGTYYYAANRVYSVVALTDSSQNVVERYRYDTYGRLTVLAADSMTTRPASSYGDQVGFTGRYLDQETGLWYFRARYFHPVLGRFAQRDPVGYVDGFDLYGGYFIPNQADPLGFGIVQVTPR